MTTQGPLPTEVLDRAIEVPSEMPRVAVLLPPRETFDPAGAGAIALLAARMAAAGGPSGAFQTFVLGRPVAAPFPRTRFVAVRQAWRLGKLPVRYAAGALPVLRRLRPALIEVHNRPDIALYLRQRLDTPVILFLHNDPIGMRGAAGLARLDRVVAVSSWVARRGETLGQPGCCLVLPNAIDLAAIPPVPQAPEGREKLILFAGRVVADKGADAFARACAVALPRLPGWRAEMIGADGFGPATRETSFLRRLRPLAAAASIGMPGWQPHAHVLQAMARAAIVVVPSRWPEPFGMAALEAMACGAALLFAPRGGLPEVVGDAGIAIDPEDAVDMADALVALAGDAGRRAALGAAARARAALFDVPRIAARLDALRAGMLARGSASYMQQPAATGE